MRRKDRQVSDPAEIKAILDKCSVCRLGLSENNLPYVVPLTFGYELSGNQLTLFFHCANEGRKLDMIKANPHACFEMDCGNELINGTTACTYSMAYESIIGNGTVQFVNDTPDKIYGLSRIMSNVTGKDKFEYSEDMVNRVTILKITTDDFTGKRHAK